MDVGQDLVYVLLFIALYFEVFLMISFFEHKPGEKTFHRPKYFPTVDILVPCYNEERTLAGTVKSLLALEYPKDKLHIVIINDGSRDNTLHIANRFAKNPQVKILSKENGGKYTALNLGIVHSTAELIGCLDADSFVLPDALIESVKRFSEEKGIMAVVPAMKVHNPRNLLELMQAVEYTFGIFYKKMFDNLSAISVLPGPFSIYRREVFEKIGIFRHAHNTEDMEMAFRMHANGLSIKNAHTSVVYTKVPRTVRALIKQRTRWSQGFLQNSADYRYMYLNRKFGHLGLLVLPFGMVMFFGALYMWAYIIFRTLSSVTTRVMDMFATHIPPHIPKHLEVDWFYINTSALTFIAITTLGLTLTAILLGRRIAGRNFGFGALIPYVAIYGFIAPLWLAQAAWGAARSQETVWRDGTGQNIAS